MRLTLKTKQVAGVTSIVGVAVIGLSAIHLASLARVGLEESASRAEMLAHAIYQRARPVVAGSADPHPALRTDPGIRSLLESGIAYSKNVTYVAIADPRGRAIAHSFQALELQPLPDQPELKTFLQQGPTAQLRAIYSDRTLEVRQPLLRGPEEFGSIRIGISTLLIRSELQKALRPAMATALVALVVATLGAMLLGQWLLRPIHVLRTGLSRLGRGEFGVKLDLPPGDEFSDLSRSFNSISAQLSAERDRVSGEQVPLDSVVERLEDAVAIFSPTGELMFMNAAMRATLPQAAPGRRFDEWLPEGHPYRRVLEETRTTRQGRGPVKVEVSSSVPAGSGTDRGPQPAAVTERLVLTHTIGGGDRTFVGIMLIVRNLAYLDQVERTISYSRKLAALGRLMAGVAHEVKNPLNAMTIHLELLKQKLAAAAASGLIPGAAYAFTAREAGGPAPIAGSTGLSPVDKVRQATGAALANAESPEHEPQVDPGVLKHVTVIAEEIQRLDQVVQGFLRFTRPAELQLEPMALGTLVDEVVRVIEPEARQARVVVRVESQSDLPLVNADRAMLRQALLNLALNACQAMPAGGTLRIACTPAADHRVAVEVEDTGVGIEPRDLEKIFDLYFTTKEQGSGIGLSMVYRIVQLHDGEVEVQSTPGHGTTFRLLLPQAP